MALDFYRIDPEHVFAEGNWRAMNAYLSDEEFIVDDFVEYMKLLNSRGITTTMEMGISGTQIRSTTLDLRLTRQRITNSVTGAIRL